MYNGKRVLTMYDPPHLLKNIRNDKLWLCICKRQNCLPIFCRFLLLDSTLPIRVAPKLTLKHINLPMSSKISVKLTAQVLSHSVAAGITTLVSLDAFPKMQCQLLWS